MNEDPKTNWQLLAGDGSSSPIPPDKFTSLKAELEQLCTDAGSSVNDRRQMADDTRYCRWPGQSPDGRKHEENLDGAKAFPFEGASDARVRLGDEITQEQVIVIMAAIVRMQVGVKGTEASDMELAAEVNTLWQWIQHNQLGAEWFVEMSKVIQYRQGDSPAVGILQVNWHEEKALQEVTTSSDDISQRAVAAAQAQNLPITPQDGTDLQDLLSNPGRLDELAQLIQALWPEMPAPTADRVAKEVALEGESKFAYPYSCENRLRVKARRMFHDIFVPENTHDLQRARVIFVREWFTETELREREAAGDFAVGFVDQVLEHEGESGWKEFYHQSISGDYSSSPLQREWDKARHRGQYELFTAFFRASNKLGIPGIYTVQFHAEVETPGTDMALYESPRCRYPFFAIPREILDDSLWNSRSIPELTMTDQQSLKQLHDSFMDHVQLVTIPPIAVPASRPKMALVFRPLGQIKEQRPGEIHPIVLGQYPVANDKVQDAIERRVARYFGRMAATNMPDWTRLYQQFLVDSCFVVIAEIVRYSLELAWEYLPDDTLARVLGHQIDREKDQMDYDVQSSFEAGMLNLEYLKEVGQMISSYVLAWDTMSTVQRDRLVRWFLSSLSPTLAQELLVPAATAQQTEIDDEQKNFTLISAGIEPPMIDAGQNFGLRLQTLLTIGQKNPEAFSKLTPVSRQILEARLKHLQGMVQQQQNAQIGRQQARPALEPPPAAAAAGAT